MKKILVVGFLILAAILLIGLIVNMVPSDEDIYIVTMKNNEGEEMGTVTLTETKPGVLLDINLIGLNPHGEHAFHINEKADCSPITTFQNAGDIYNPFDNAHGLKHPEGHKAGDMPNLKPDDIGVLKAKVLNFNVTLDPKSDSGRAPLFDQDGSSIIIHEGPDDHISQPSGNAGARIMCGEIKLLTASE